MTPALGSNPRARHSQKNEVRRGPSRRASAPDDAFGKRPRRRRRRPQRGREVELCRMRDEALSPLRAGRAATYRPYDWESGLLATRSVMIAPASVVVVEGLFVSRPELEPFIDLSVLVEAPPAVRSHRQLERPDSGEWLRRWDAAERLFFEQIRPRQSTSSLVATTRAKRQKEGQTLLGLSSFSRARRRSWPRGCRAGQIRIQAR